MPARKRIVWTPGQVVRGKNDGVRKVLSVNKHNGDVTFVVLDPAGHMDVSAGDRMTVTHLSMKRWASNDSKMTALVEG